MTLMDADDTFETHSYSFSGLDSVLARFAEQISGATGIPLVRLFGQSPSGFNTGDADLANYYDNIATQQSRRLKQPLRKLFEILHQSALGEPLPDDFTFAFNPLWQMSDMDKSTVAVNMINALNAAQDGVMLSTKFVDTVSQDNATLWQQHSREMSRELKQLIAETPVGHVMQSLVHEQIKYIKSLPIDAADRVYSINFKMHGKTEKGAYYSCLLLGRWMHLKVR